MIKLKKWMMNPCEECTHILSDETGEAVIVCSTKSPSGGKYRGLPTPKRWAYFLIVVSADSDMIPVMDLAMEESRPVWC